MICDRSCLRNQFEQKIEPFARKLGAKESHPRDTAAWPTEAGDKAVSHWITCNRKDDGNRRGGLLGRKSSVWRTGCDDHCHLTFNQISGQPWQEADLIIRPTVFDRYILAREITRVGKSLSEGGSEC